MRVDIRLGAPPLQSRPNNPKFSPFAVNRLGRSGQSRGTPITHARFLTENGVPPSGNTHAVVGQSIAGCAPGVVRSKWRE